MPRKAIRIHEYIHFLEAFLILGIVSTGLSVLPFRWIAKWLGVAHSVQIHSAQKQSAAPLPHTSQTADIRTAILRATRRAFWHPACLSRAISGKIMLHYRGIPSMIVFGVTKDRQSIASLRAHAWLMVDDVAILGGKTADEYRPIAHFY